MHNGYGAALAGSRGAARSGIENVKTVVSRGVLLDIPRILGVDHLEPGFAIGADLLDEACEAHGVEVGAGDMVLVRTGDMARRRELPGWDGRDLDEVHGGGAALRPALSVHRRAPGAVRVPGRQALHVRSAPTAGAGRRVHPRDRQVPQGASIRQCEASAKCERLKPRWISYRPRAGATGNGTFTGHGASRASTEGRPRSIRSSHAGQSDGWCWAISGHASTAA
ncbi:MAG: cyclase family protein [Acidimicrobiaceae bacterium]|nr:cyclase family protein [Acidimicrobiaceae bacterium]MYE96484.1 cyclase family protein [Acidimicrobiaceae bacterium]MYH44645.1 cyclase family protein [Acidimicrobiaceae bacterium]MYK74780.1 cyclase family protein [Acidimicrobiaceae bacterium]